MTSSGMTPYGQGNNGHMLGCPPLPALNQGGYNPNTAAYNAQGGRNGSNNAPMRNQRGLSFPT